MEVLDKITAKQLAFLLNIKVKDAVKIVCQVMEYDYSSFEESGGKDCEMIVDRFETKRGYSLRPYLEDIYNNYMKRGATRSYLMDLPQKKINDYEKKGLGVPGKVSIPAVLSSLMSAESKKQVLKGWQQRYNDRFPKMKFQV